MAKIILAQNGFTLIELMLSVAIVAILFSAGITAYIRGQRAQEIKSVSESMLIALQSAQKRSLIGDKDCSGALSGYQLTISSGSGSWTVIPKCDGGDGTPIISTFPKVKFGSSQTLVFRPLGAGIELPSGNVANIDYTYGSSGEVYRVAITKTGSITYEGKQP